MPDYAELTLPNLQFPLICVHFIRHSLTHGLLADTAVGSGLVSTGASENAYLTALRARCPGHKFCDGCLWVHCDSGELCRSGRCGTHDERAV